MLCCVLMCPTVFYCVPFCRMCSDDIQSMDHASWGLLRLMWKRNTCVTVLCSFRTFGAQSINYESEPVTSNPVDPKGMEISLENELATSFTDDDVGGVKGERGEKGEKGERSEKGDRVLVIELPPLDENAIAALALRLLRAHCASFEIDAKMLTVVHRLSGGNPLYAVEVSIAAIRMVDKMRSSPSPAKLTAREIAHAKFNLSNKSCGRSRFDDELDARGQEEFKNPINSPWEMAFMKVSSSLRSDRIEEIVIFRFDQLDSKSQLLLRIAAVAGYNNAPFSVEMLVYILPHFSSARTQDELFERAGDDDDDVFDFDLNTASDGDVETKAGRAIVRALKKILRDSEFLRVCKSSNDSIDDNEIESGKFNSSSCDIDTSCLHTQSFEFVSSLVQATVLNLNLRAQNAILHFQTASYIESQITPRLQATKSNTQLYLMTGMDSHSWSSNSFLSWFTKSSCSPSTVSSATW
jgi:predicted ATPase